MLIWCLDPRDCTSATSWIDFLIAIWLLILVMIKMNGKMSKKWSKWIKNEATWATIWASEARLAVYVTFYFIRNILKNTCIKLFYHTVGYQINPACTVVFYDYVHECSKRAYFHLSLKFIFFFTFSSIYLLIMFLTWHKTLATNWTNFCNLVQLWYVIISMMSFYSLTVLKTQHT